jgi:hypothetical protein
MLPQKLHQQDEDDNQKGHHKEREEAFEDV